VVTLTASLLLDFGTNPTGHVNGGTNNGSTLIAVAAALSIATTAAFLARLLQIYSRISAYLGSVLLAALSTFLIAVVARAQDAKFKHLDGSSTSAMVIYWFTVGVFFAINAETVFKDFIASERKQTPPEESAEDAKQRAEGALAVLALITVGWLLAVWLGESSLVGGLV